MTSFPPHDPRFGTMPDANAAMIRTAPAIKLKSQLVIDASLSDPKVAGLPMLRDVSDTVSWANKELRISSPGGADEFLMVSLQTDFAEDGKLFLDAVTHAYLTEFINTENELRSRRYESLKALKDRYDADEKRRREFVAQWHKNIGNNVEAVSMRQTMLEKEINEYRDYLIKLNADIMQQRIEVNSLKTRDPSKLSLDDSTFLEFYAKDKLFGKLKQNFEE